MQAAWSGQQPLTSVERQNAEGQWKIAEGCETQETLTAVVKDREVQWMERRLIIRSLSYTKTAETALRLRLEKAKRALNTLNEHKQGKRRIADKPA